MKKIKKGFYLFEIFCEKSSIEYYCGDGSVVDLLVLEGNQEYFINFDYGYDFKIYAREKIERGEGFYLGGMR